MSRPRLSVLIVARNEETRLEDCLTSASFADEVVVVLDRSTDRSRDIAIRLGGKAIDGEWQNEGNRRNFAIAQCNGDWILELDADERISSELRQELSELLSDEVLTPGRYVIPFHNHFCGIGVRRGWGAYNGVAAKACLFARGMKVWGDGEVHPPIKLSGEKRYLTGHIDHFVDDDIHSMVLRLNWYSTGAAKNSLAQRKIPTLTGTIRRSFSRFLRSYLIKKGCLEGWRGLALALFSGLYPLLTYIKIQEIKSR
ncbi:MAG: glycosyltransferase family 2 protein [Alphaproteobacteria bacterium]|nr:glycosyltransferase family 2 protein [Alphaproteobacteria bacterium]